MKKQLYLAPEISELEINVEGLLCQSGESGSGAGAGELDDNPWTLN